MRVRHIPAAGRLIPLAVLLVACAAPGPRGGMAGRLAAVLDSIAADSARAAGPRVAITTDHDIGRFSRVITRLRVEEDAYVAVVNVSPSGYASVVFPESATEPVLLRGGKTYVMPSQFTGYHLPTTPIGSAGTQFVWYGRSTSARLGARGPGYLFVIASRAPLNLAALEDEGYFDEVDAGQSVYDMEPDEVIPRVAVIANTGAGIAADYARYSGYDPAAYASTMFRSSYNTYCQAPFGLYAQSSFWQNAGWGRSGCDPVGMQRLYRLVRPPVVVAPPAAPDDSTADSTATDGAAKWRRLLPIPANGSLLTDSETPGAGTLRSTPRDEREVMLTREERRRAIAAARAEARTAAAHEGRTARDRDDVWGRPRGEMVRPRRGSARTATEGERAGTPEADAPRRARPVERPRSERVPEPRTERQERRPSESRPSEPRSTESRPTESRPTAPVKGESGKPARSDPS